jgi:hypothetical protein
METGFALLSHDPLTLSGALAAAAAVLAWMAVRRIVLPAAHAAGFAIASAFGPRPIGTDALVGFDLPRAVNAGPMVIGGIVGTFLLFDRKIFTWYLSEGLALVPNYGSVTCWIINAAALLVVALLIGLALAAFRRCGRVAGLVIAPAWLLSASVTIVAAILCGPAALIFAWLLIRNAFVLASVALDPIRILRSAF